MRDRLRKISPGRSAMLLLAGTLVLLWCPEIRAQSAGTQTYTVMLRNVPLDVALAQIASAAEINLIYDSRLAEHAMVFCVLRDAPAHELLRCVLAGTGLDYFQTSSGTYVLTESVRAAPRYGEFVGIVVDGQTGRPLPHANVLLADAGVGTAANEAGLFSFSMLKPGPYRVVTTYVGYETKIDSVWIVPGAPVRERLAMNARSVTTEPILVTGLEHRLPSQALGNERLTGADLAANSNDFGAADVSRSTAALPGLTIQEPWADLHLQGGAAGELQMRLDGIPVRNPVTLGQLLGAFSPLAIDRMTVQKAGFGVAHGSNLSGSVSAEHALSRAQHRYVKAQFDPLSFNARAQTSWKTGNVETRTMVAARTSLWTFFEDPALGNLLRDWHVVDPLLTPPAHGSHFPSEPLDHRGDVRFSDLHAAARVQFGPFRTIHASAYRGENQVESIATARSPEGSAPSDELVTRDDYRWTNTGGRIRYEGLIGRSMLGSMTAYGSRQFLGHGYSMPDPDVDPYYPAIPYVSTPYDGNWVDEYALEAGLDVNLARRHHLTTALSATRTASRTLIHNDFFRQLDYSSAQWRFAGFAQNDISLGLRTSLELGVRLTYIPDRQTLYGEPRLALRYDGHHDALGDYAFRLAGGIYRQFVNEFDLSSTGPMGILPFIRFWLPVDASLSPPRAYHLAADALWNPANPWSAKLEAYYKWQPHLLDIDYPELLNGDVEGEISYGSFIAPTEGRAIGGDIQVQYSTRALKSAVKYSLMHSARRFPGRFDDRMQPAPWEQPHRLSIENTANLTPELALQLNWRGVWGRSWGFRRAYYDFLAPQPEISEGLPFDLNDPSRHELSPLYQLDAGFSYEYVSRSFSVLFGARVLNVLDRRNEFDWSLHETDDGFERITRTLPGRRPVFSLSLSF